MRTRAHYEEAQEYTADAYRVARHARVAWSVLGWETAPDEDTEWSGHENRTGQLVCVMVGDDRKWLFDPSDVTPLADHEYCHECGQIGCGHSLREETDIE